LSGLPLSGGGSTFPAENMRLEYDVTYLGMKVGDVSLAFLIESGTLSVLLKAESRGLAEVLVPFHITCSSKYDLNKGHFLQYRQDTSFKKIHENFLVLRYENGYFVFLLVKPDNSLIEKYPHLVDKIAGLEELIPLRMRQLPLQDTVCDPLSFIYRLCNDPVDGTAELRLKLFVDNSFREIILGQSRDEKRFYLAPEIDLPGVFPSGTKVRLSVSRDQKRIPERLELSVPGIGNFKIKLVSASK
ncbi:MAG: DUF3108 domain-containing protein, partial [Candidatus Wallbacteria bacterium]|nr:DUF3108 domain-containing protein [Candidatus Wallbacteria bacterium]